MLAQLQPHLFDIACLVLISLFIATESLPFFQKIKANGIAHGIYLKAKEKLSARAKAALEKK